MASASTNPNLIVSAENAESENHFAGSMVVGVVVHDTDLSSTGTSAGEPDVTINGADLRMVQGTDGRWYAYFANLQKAAEADRMAQEPGKGLDFGVFCSGNTDEAVLGVSFSEAEAVAVARAGGLTGAASGFSTNSACTGTVDPGPVLNNVVRHARSINANPAVQPGQIGLDPDAWPVVQLFSFREVVIKYNKAGSDQEVRLKYDEIPNISLSLDREEYPAGSEVFVTINDMQLNQDPTDEDSWTFAVGDQQATFYQAFSESGAPDASGGAGLVNILPSLRALGFDDNGRLSLDLGNIAALKTNKHQPDSFVTDGTQETRDIFTVIETRPNSGVFISYDNADRSVLGIRSDAPRGQAATIGYNSRSHSILTGSTDAAVSVDVGREALSGTRNAVSVTDNDQNLDSIRKDRLEVAVPTDSIPIVKIGSPVTLGSASDVRFYDSGGDLSTTGTAVGSSGLDEISERLAFDIGQDESFDFEAISMNLGVSAGRLSSLFIGPGDRGTNWINYDLRALATYLEADLSRARIEMHFGLPDPSPVILTDSGAVSNRQGLLQLDDSDIAEIAARSGPAYIVINLDPNNRGTGGTANREDMMIPIVIDLFSFGEKGRDSINNAIYRFEFEETSVNSGVFAGTMEHVIINQINIFDPGTIRSLDTIDEDVRLLISERLVGSHAISLKYADVSGTGTPAPASTRTEITTHTGAVGFGSKSYRFGQPVLVRLVDPDLNLNSDAVDVYRVINDPRSPNVDAVGTADGGILLEVKIKGARYQRCTVDGTVHGGLGAGGFSMRETGPATGVFEGQFKMPTWICNRDGSGLISAAGGSLDAVYYDFRDSSGNENIVKTKGASKSKEIGATFSLDTREVSLPREGHTNEIVLSGSMQNPKRGEPVSVTLGRPDGSSSSSAVTPSSDGRFQATIPLEHDSPAGRWSVDLQYAGMNLGQTTFSVSDAAIPDWIKRDAGRWSDGQVDQGSFARGIRHLADAGVISPAAQISGSTYIPEWIREPAGWWAEGQISQDEFLDIVDFLVKKGIIRV